MAQSGSNVAIALASTASGPLPYISTTALGCTNTTGDGALIQAAINAVPLTAPVHVMIDCPVMLNESNYDPNSNGVKWAVGWARDNVTIEWAPGGVVNRTTTTGCPFFVSGAGKPSGITSWFENKFTDQGLVQVCTDANMTSTLLATTSAAAAAQGTYTLTLGAGGTATGTFTGTAPTTGAVITSGGTGVVSGTLLVGTVGGSTFTTTGSGSVTTAGTCYVSTTISVNALSSTITSGTSIVFATTSGPVTVVASATASSGATSISVTTLQGALGSGNQGYSAASCTLTTASSTPFKSTDVGTTILLPGANSGGVNLTSTIIAYNSSSSVTLLNPARTSVSGNTLSVNRPFLFTTPTLLMTLSSGASIGATSLSVTSLPANINANQYVTFSTVNGPITAVTSASASAGATTVSIYALGGSILTGTSGYTALAPTKGAVTISLAAPGSTTQPNGLDPHTTFSAGDYVYIFTGQLDAASQGPYAIWPTGDAECFRILSVTDDGSGTTASNGNVILTLEGALGKSYAQEYFSSSAISGPTTTTSTSYPAMFGAVKVTGLITFNTTFINPNFNTAQTDRNQISHWQTWNTRIFDGQSVGPAGLHTGRDNTYKYLLRNNVRVTGTGGGMGYGWVLAASGDRDCYSEDNYLQGDSTTQFIHIHEGGVRCRSVRDTVIANGGIATASGLWDVAARQYDFQIIDPIGSGTYQYGINVDSYSTGGGIIRAHGGAFSGTISTDAYNIGPTGVQLDIADSAVGVAKSGSNGSASAATPIYTISATVTSSLSGTARTVGTIPQNALITGIQFITTTAWAGGTSPSISLGIASATARYCAAQTSINTQGINNITPLVGTGTPVFPSRQTVIATVVKGGSTSGSTTIVVSYSIIGSLV